MSLTERDASEKEIVHRSNRVIFLLIHLNQARQKGHNILIIRTPFELTRIVFDKLCNCDCLVTVGDSRNLVEHQMIILTGFLLNFQQSTVLQLLY